MPPPETEETRKKRIAETIRRALEIAGLPQPTPTAIPTPTATATPVPSPQRVPSSRILSPGTRAGPRTFIGWANYQRDQEEDRGLLGRMVDFHPLGGALAPIGKAFTTPISTPARKDASLLQRLDQASRPFEAFAQIFARALTPPGLRSGPEPTTLNLGRRVQEESELFRQRPWWQQLGLGVLDPFLLAGAGPRSALKGIQGIRPAETPAWLAGQRMARESVRPQLALGPGRIPGIPDIPESVLPRRPVGPLVPEGSVRALPGIGETANQPIALGAGKLQKRPRTVEELLEAGGYEAPGQVSPVPGTGARATPDDVRFEIDRQVQQSHELGDLEVQARDVYLRQGDWRGQTEPTQIRTVLRKSSRDVTEDTATLDDVLFAIREEKGRIEKRIQELQEIGYEDLAAREAAMQRGIEKIGLEEAVTTEIPTRTRVQAPEVVPSTPVPAADIKRIITATERRIARMVKKIADMEDVDVAMVSDPAVRGREATRLLKLLGAKDKVRVQLGKERANLFAANLMRVGTSDEQFIVSLRREVSNASTGNAYPEMHSVELENYIRWLGAQEISLDFMTRVKPMMWEPLAKTAEAAPARAAPVTAATRVVVDLPDPSGGFVKLPGVYVRFGELPRGNAPSFNFLSNRPEEGVSVYKAWRDPKTQKYVLQVPGADIGTQQELIGDVLDRGLKLYEVRGDVIPRVLGGDFEDLLRPGSVKVEREIPASQIVSDDTPYLLLSGDELPIDQIPNWSTEAAPAQLPTAIRRAVSPAVAEQAAVPVSLGRDAERGLVQGGGRVTTMPIEETERQITQKITGLSDLSGALKIRDVDLRQAELLRIEQAITDPTEAAIASVARQVRDAAPFSTAQIKKLRSEELSRRVAASAEILRTTSGQEGFARSKGPLAGALPNPNFTVPNITSEQVHLLTERIRLLPRAQMPHLSKESAYDALLRLLAGEVPQRAELRLLENAFGPEMVEAFTLRSRTFRGEAVSFVKDILLLPKSIRSSFDISFPFRQGMLVGPRNPRNFVSAFKSMLQSVNKGKAVEINQELFARARKLNLIDRGPGRTELFMPDVEGAAGLSSLARAREEAYLSRFVEGIPGIRLSQRTFNTFGNKIKVDLAEKAVNNWRRDGVEVTPEMIDSLNRFLNVFTGRGSLGKFEPIADTLNIAFWSPRLLASRIQAPLLLADPVVRKMAAQNLAATFGLGVSILGVVKASGLGSVELDPRSSDFGKIRIGRARIDFWGGFQPIARYMAQIATNQSKDLDTGEISKGDEWPFTSRADRIFFRFGRSKLAPGIPVILANELFGKSFLGEKLGVRADKGRLPAPLDEFFNRLGVNSVREVEAIQQVIPLFSVDLIDAIDEFGAAPGLGFSVMPFVGIGTQIFNIPREEEAEQRYQEAFRNRVRVPPTRTIYPTPVAR
jgi:hypothetical protein